MTKYEQLLYSESGVQNTVKKYRGLGEVWVFSDAYTYGQLPPRYPVPAIRIKTYLYDGYSVINRHDDAWYILG